MKPIDEKDENSIEKSESDADDVITTTGDRWLPEFIPNSYTESISIAGTEYGGLECAYLAECIYGTEKRFFQRLRLEPRLTPHWYSTTTFLFMNSTRKRYKDLILFLPKLKTSSFSETVFVFPKAMRRIFTTTVTYNKHWRVTRWYTSGMELGPKVTPGGKRLVAVLAVNGTQ